MRSADLDPQLQIAASVLRQWRSDHRYVSLTTYRRNGDEVATPVWIAPLDGGRAGFTTGSASGKVKRLRHDHRVVLRPCDARGRVPAEAVEVSGTAEVATGGPRVDQVVDAIGHKYSWQFRALQWSSKVKALFSSPATDCVVVIDLES